MKHTFFIGILLMLNSFMANAERLVVAGGTITDIVYALNAGDKVVAVDTSSTWPPKAAALPKVGYYRDLAAEGILSQKPTMILTLEGAGRPEVLTQIKSTGVPVHHYDKPDKVDDLYTLINQVAKELKKEHQAATLIKSLKSQLPEKPKPSNTKALFILSAGERGVMVAGKETVPEVLFNYTGIKNIATHNGFKPINRESMLVANPDFIIAPSHVVYGAGGPEKFCNQAALALIPAAKECRLLVMDSLMALGMTTRLPEAIAKLDAFHRKQAL
ncbi:MULTISPECIES: heme/hemin ABC transporter substrate-binding protein [Pseudoalteromonas]|uniref:ABC transporter substrate-binding protein n=1 Tax=Pseudoalteromonas obscura TaxID=3048491 RepID=A0ABT7EHM4_9GAMM|nr:MULTISPECIES: ABC transporter substrate-binding protein [Pseudoalteromonas]MBQ4836169.1 ABC transporter substrate-binding protein [Pseudoalteromonas luteoviolacea]MDK2594518.1 ABC transporter substrate-binding protein [Pseudoalteromonas sp. P94(2023)]